MADDLKIFRGDCGIIISQLTNTWTTHHLLSSSTMQPLLLPFHLYYPARARVVQTMTIIPIGTTLRLRTMSNTPRRSNPLHRRKRKKYHLFDYLHVRPLVILLHIVDSAILTPMPPPPQPVPHLNPTEQIQPLRVIAL